MGSVFLAVPLVVVLAVALVLVAVVVPRRRSVPTADETAHPGLGQLRWVSLATRVAAVVVGAVLVVLAAGVGGLGLGLALAPVVFGGCQVLGVLLADALSRGAARTLGVAALELRRARDLLPGRLTWTTVGAAAVLVLLLTWTTLVASADDQGRVGRALGYRCVTGCDRASVGPWPGVYYSLPLAVGVPVVALLSVVALRHAAHRPRNGTDPEVLRVDGAIRRRAAESVIAGAGIAVTGSLSGVAAMVGLRLLQADHAPASLLAATWPALGLALTSLAALLWCLTVLLLPGPDRASAPVSAPAGSPGTQG